MLGGLLTVGLGLASQLVGSGSACSSGGGSDPARSAPTVHGEESRHPVLNGTVVAASFVAALTFAVMIGCFYLAEQYLQRAAGFSALGASAVLVVVALLVGVAAPFAGTSRRRARRAYAGDRRLRAAAVGLSVLGIPGMPLHSGVTIIPLIPVGLGLGMLFVPTSRAALNSTPLSSHGRTSAVLSVGRLLGAAVGAGLAGTAIAGGVDASKTHTRC